MSLLPAPRLLRAREAAAYFQLPVTQFERLHVGRVAFGTRILYDRLAPDDYLDAVSGRAPRSSAHAPTEPEAALARFAADLAHAARRPPGP
jgi:hypothetical protein